MRFADFVKKHFPLEHPKVSGKFAKILGRPKKRKARTISGFTRGQEVEFTHNNWGYNEASRRFESQQVAERGTVRRVYGEYVYIMNDNWTYWPHQAHMNNVRAI